MDVLMSNISTVLTASRDGGGTLQFMPKQSIEHCAPGALPPLRNDQLPYIGIAPMSAPERWVTSGKREVTYTVELYCCYFYSIQSDCIDKFVAMIRDVMSIVRNQKFSDYLSAPCEAGVTSYALTQFGDSTYLLVGTITIEGRRIFISQT